MPLLPSKVEYGSRFAEFILWNRPGPQTSELKWIASWRIAKTTIGALVFAALMLLVDSFFDILIANFTNKEQKKTQEMDLMLMFDTMIKYVTLQYFR